ncbi:hypothetical protein INT47_001114 [Mucor saturninus]|uniref:P-loop containing nucleoside triphosphate hydrolase protein n=1 Tax=Mucor saturninus TaxID=64648 RepID=A0A8H7VB17_9FUNG|nr:hypothetical protein INT47_001114 [Mucor saturninus]
MTKQSSSFLHILGAGYGRTGTMSLRDALNILGYKTHHMEDTILDPTQDPKIFEDAYKNPNDIVDWEKAFRGYTAAVDWPAVAFFDKIYALNADAKVILTIRDPESWFKSVSSTIHEWPNVDESWPQNIVKARKMARVVVRDGELGGADTEKRKAALIQKFTDHIEHIKSIVKPENLLIFDLGKHGWEELCQFLGKDVPIDTPYPHSNKREDFPSRLLKIKELSVGLA